MADRQEILTTLRAKIVAEKWNLSIAGVVERILPSDLTVVTTTSSYTIVNLIGAGRAGLTFLAVDPGKDPQQAGYKGAFVRPRPSA